MATTPQEMLQVFIGFSGIAALTWCFSHRPRWFIRLFAPRDEVWPVARRVLRKNGEFRRGMRIMALLQFAMAVGFAVAALWLWLA